MILRGLTAMLLWLSVSALAMPVRVSLPEHLENSSYRQQVENSLEDLYFSAGHQVQFLYIPQTRAFKMLAQRKLDAIGYVSPQNPVPDIDLVRVSESLTEMQLFVACEIGKDCDVNKDTRFAFIKGSPTAERECSTKALNCMSVASHVAAQKALHDGLVNGYLLERSKHLEQRCFTHLGMTLRPIGQSQTPVYHYMRKEYGSVAKELAGKLRALKDTKEILGGWSSCQSEIDWQRPVSL